METRTIASSLATVIIVGLLAYFTWGVAIRLKPAPLPAPQGTTVCTADAKQCPDGSWVGRTGPDCTFVCPTATTSPAAPTSLDARLHEKITLDGEGVTPQEVLEDSRCPESVQCIQAGTVRVRVLIESGLGASEKTMKIGDTVTTEANVITLVSVQPAKKIPGVIDAASYVFTFAVVQR